MTIAEKSTADGVNYEQNVLDANPIKKHTLDGAFVCFTAGGRGKNLNVIDNEGVQISNGGNYYRYCTDMEGIGDTLTETSTLAEVQADFLAWYGSQEFYAIPTQEVVEDLT